MGPILAGIVLVLFGIKLLFIPKWFNPIWGRLMDFTNYNIFFGSICILFGILFIGSEIRKRMKKKNEQK